MLECGVLFVREGINSQPARVTVPRPTPEAEKAKGNLPAATSVDVGLTLIV